MIETVLYLNILVINLYLLLLRIEQSSTPVCHRPCIGSKFQASFSSHCFSFFKVFGGCQSPFPQQQRTFVLGTFDIVRCLLLSTVRRLIHPVLLLLIFRSRLDLQ